MDDRLVRAALEAGARKAALIPGSAVAVSEEFRHICETGRCGAYGRCWMCPPHIGPIDALMAKVRSYPRGLLYQTIRTIEDGNDIEGMFAAGSGHAWVSQRFNDSLKSLLGDGFLHLTCGGCHLCPVCAKRENLPCRMPDRALPSLEGYGVDVYSTALHTPLSYTNGVNTVTFFGLVLF